MIKNLKLLLFFIVLSQLALSQNNKKIESVNLFDNDTIVELSISTNIKALTHDTGKKKQISFSHAKI